MPRRVSAFHDFVGQKELVDQLRRQAAGAQALKQSFPHTLILGSSGLGKTRLARATAAEYGTEVIETMGDLSKAELVNRLVALNENDFLFIDEAHALKNPMQELLYGAIDHCQVPRVPGTKAANGSLQDLETPVEIRPFTLILATDQPSRILNALQKRMALKVPINYYAVEELKEIVERVAKRMDLHLTAQAAHLLAKVSAGVPRRVEHHLQNLQRHHSDARQEQIGVPQVREFLAAFDIDDKGLGAQERAYLNFLRNVEAASLESLAIRLGVDSEYVRRQIEPLLLREHLVAIGSSGRRLTQAGEEWVNQPNIITKE
jgi:Holliday junction DNA helicase RuvB